MSEYSARNFMRVAEVYGKRGNIPDLPLSALYELAAPKTPPEVREEVDRLLAAGELVTKAKVESLRAQIDGLWRKTSEQEAALAESRDALTAAKANNRQTLSVEVDAAAQKIEQSHADEEARLRAEIRATRTAFR